jgi:hypothetical protein
MTSVSSRKYSEATLAAYISAQPPVSLLPSQARNVAKDPTGIPADPADPAVLQASRAALQAEVVGTQADLRADQVDLRADPVDLRADKVDLRVDRVDLRVDRVDVRVDRVGQVEFQADRPDLRGRLEADRLPWGLLSSAPAIPTLTRL